MRVRLVLCLISLVLVGGLTTPALAQVITDVLPTQIFDPSIEAAGMGGASIAAFWEENPNDHANPALMGFHSGLRYSYGTTQLVPELADDVHYASHRILAGAWGIGVAMSGKPIESVGYVGINYGPTEITDVDGNVIGEAEATEHVRSIAVGLSVFDLISSIRVARGGEPLSFNRRLSLALGHAWKTYDIEFAPFIEGEGNNNDAGILLRVAPFDQIGETLRDANDRLRWKVDVAGAYTRLDYLNDRTVDFDNGGSSDELFGHRSIGGSVQFTMALPNDGVGDLWDFATPSIRLGVTYEHTDTYEGDTKLGEFAKRYGAELSVIDMLYLRYGHVKGEVGLDDATFGAGFSLKYRNMIGVKGDYASYPRTADVLFFVPDDTYDRWGLTFFVDPYRLLKKGAD